MSEKNPIRTARTLIQDLPADSNELSDLSPQELEATAVPWQYKEHGMA